MHTEINGRHYRASGRKSSGRFSLYEYHHPRYGWRRLRNLNRCAEVAYMLGGPLVDSFEVPESPSTPTLDIDALADILRD